MRWTVSGPGYAIANALRFKSAGLARYAVITGIAFLLSGIVHMGLVPPEPLHATMTANGIRFCVGLFFWLQPFAMLIEVVTVRLVAMTNGFGSSSFRMAAVAVWVIAWFTVTLPLIGVLERQLGYWQVWPMPISVWSGVTSGQWIVWPILLRQI
jgi:hypothetical protein